MAYYVLDDEKNLVAAFDREGVLGVLEQAIREGSLENIDEDSAVASKLKSNISGGSYHIEFCTQAKYNELKAAGELVAGTYYFITDDTTAEDLEMHITQNDARIDAADAQIAALDEKVDFLMVSGNLAEGTFDHLLDIVTNEPNYENIVYRAEGGEGDNQWWESNVPVMAFVGTVDNQNVVAVCYGLYGMFPPEITYSTVTAETYSEKAAELAQIKYTYFKPKNVI